MSEETVLQLGRSCRSMLKWEQPGQTIPSCA